ncbi:hypothetical protein CASFOL_036796 [Castilleja foliolosa]|uniref:Uncharacterized protein n=1 Tax=Castilleja foliolosa TaxID=1961234 RepID=A0ABD3BQF5_9LAMI
MGSPEGFGSGGVVVGDVRWQTENACSSGDNTHAVNVSAPAFWLKSPDSEVRVESCPPSGLHSDDLVNYHASANTKSHPPALDLDAKPLRQRCGKIVRKNSGGTKRSGVAHMEVSKNKFGLHDVNGTFPELVSSSASCNVTEKNQLVKQKNSSTSRRGDKRNSKATQKSRCDSFSLKNGLVGFNSAAGGNNFIGLCGSKYDVFDITKYVDEPPLDELLCGSYRCSFIKDKEKTTTNSNSILLQSFRNACSILQARNVLDQNCAETDGSKGDSCSADLPTSEKVNDSDGKIKISDIADFPLYKPKDILERLALPPPKDLDVLLSESCKTTSSSKNSTDPRLGKPISQRNGLPPFPWSNSFSGHNKLGSDAVRLSTSRAICQGRWVKVKNYTSVKKDSAGLLKDFESLTFDQSLVPSLSERPENEFAPAERVLSALGASSPPKATLDEYSTTQAAAQTLLDIASYSMKNPYGTDKLLQKPSQTAMKASKLKETERSEISFHVPKSSTIRPHNPSKATRDDGFSSKKIKLSRDVPSTYISHPTTELVRKGSSPPRKLFRDPNANTDSYGTNPVKKPSLVKTPRSTDRPGSSSKPKFWKSKP